MMFWKLEGLFRGEGGSTCQIEPKKISLQEWFTLNYKKIMRFPSLQIQKKGSASNKLGSGGQLVDWSTI